MESEDDAERETNYVHNLTKEIVRECTTAGVQALPELVNHLIKLKVLNPRNGFFVWKIMSRELTQKFVRACVSDVTKVNPAMDCIRMQAYWQSVTPKLDDVKTAYSSHMAEKSHNAFMDLANVTEEEKLMKKIAMFANVHTNVGNANVALNLKETMHPLKSVFKSKDILFYHTLTETGKYEYLKFVARLVCGIRVYQHYYKKGSENVDSAPLLLSSATNSVISEAMTWLEKLSARKKLLVKELYYVHEAMPGMVSPEIPAGFSAEDTRELQDIHHIMLQHETYLRAVLSYLEDFIITVESLTSKFVESIEKLHGTIGVREAIPASDIYDKFIDICDQWSALQAESCYLICVGLIVKNLNTINKYFPLTRLEAALGLSDAEPAIKDAREKNRKIIPDIEIPEVALLSLTDETVLQFKGYCPWTLIATNGVLLPARTELGILKYENKYYGFFSAEAAELWRNRPELNIRRAYEVIRRNPHMVDLLDMYDFLVDIRTEILVKDKEEIAQMMQDVKTQTAVHPICRFYDKDYSFSEWELRYKALKLSRLINCATKSVQTSNHSHYRASIGVQCSPDKTNGTEPKRDVGCIHETVKNYFRGLRGESDARVQVLSLTRPVQESFLEVLPTHERPCMDKCRTRFDGELQCKSPSALWKELMGSLECDEREYVNIMKESQTLYSNLS